MVNAGGATVTPAEALRVGLTSVEWTMELLLASSELQNPKHNASPIVHLRLTLTDGRIVRLRLKQQELHQWRWALARAVKDTAYLQRKERFFSQKTGAAAPAAGSGEAPAPAPISK